METIQTVEIKLAQGLSAMPDIYELDNLTTEIKIDFTSMGVDHWTKYVDMEMSDGTTTRLDLGNDIIVTFPLSNSVTVTGALKVNPLAVLEIEGEDGNKRVAQKGFKTFLFNVQGTVNTYGYGSWGRDDILIPMAENLHKINEFLDLKYLDPLDDLNLRIEPGLYGYMGFNEIKNSPVLGMSILVYNVKMKDNAESVIQMLWDIHPDSPNFNKLFTRRCIPATGDWSTWSNPDAEVQALRDWTTHMIEEVVGLDEQAIQDLLNLQDEIIQLRDSFNIVNQNVVDISVNLETFKTDTLNALASQLGYINDLTARLGTTEGDLGQLSDSFVTLQSNVSTIRSELDVVKNNYLSKSGGNITGNLNVSGYIKQNSGVETMNGAVGVLPAGDINLGSYWRGLKNGLYMKSESPAQTNQLSSYAHVFVIGSTNTESAEKTVIWKAKADADIWHSGTNGNTSAMRWTKILDSSNFPGYMLVKDGTSYDRVSNTTSWLRSPSAGFLPYGNGSGSLGSDSWRFAGLHTNSANVYGNTTITGSLTVGGNRALTTADFVSGNNNAGRHNKIPQIKTDGGMEIGQFLDFHNNGTDVDYTTRLQTDGANQLSIMSNGRLLTTGNVVYVVESGTNYMRWSDGTQECWGVATATYNQGKYLSVDVTYPKAFISNPIPILTAVSSYTTDTHVNASPKSGTSATVLSIRSYATSGNAWATGNTQVIYWTAKGRWK